MEHNITPTKLAAAGYERISQRLMLLDDPLLCAVWRKEFRDEQGIRYRISISEFEMSRFTGTNVFTCETVFRFTNGGASTVTHSMDDQHIEDIEDYFEEIWCHMDFGHVEGGHDCGKAEKA